MKIGMTNAAEEDFDLHIAVSWIATLDFSRCHAGCGTGSRIGFRVVRSWLHSWDYLLLLRIESIGFHALNLSITIESPSVRVRGIL
jgi:hypothetical protein